MDDNKRFMSETQLALQQGAGEKSPIPTPRAIPGYKGHVSGMRDQGLGRRYGSSSAHLLRDQHERIVSKSQRLQLQQQQHQSSSTSSTQRFLQFSRPKHAGLPNLATSKARVDFDSMPSAQLQQTLAIEREQSHECAYRGNMVPGYCGHVPRLRDVVATPFGTATSSAISTFDKDRFKRQSRNRLTRSAPHLQRQLANRRDTASAEVLAFEANTNAMGAGAFDAPYTERTAYSRRAGAVPGTTKHIPFQEHTSVGCSFPQAVRESSKLLKAHRPDSHFRSKDAMLNQIAMARQEHMRPKQNTRTLKRVNKRDYVVSPLLDMTRR